MAWVKWKQILLPYEFGGLNVCSLKIKNLALLTKWWWRFLSGENVFWVRIIKSIYGIGGGLGCCTSLPGINLKNFSGRPWYNIIKIEDTLTKLGCNLSNAFVKDVGIGADTRFWIGKWMGDVPLKDAYPRLFKLEATPDAYIADRFDVTVNPLIFKWNWFMTPRWRTEDELFALIKSIRAHPFSHSPAIQSHPSAGPWSWKHDLSGLFSTSSLVRLLSSLAAEKVLSSPPQPTDLNPLIPQKIGIFIWRAKQNKLPVRVALDKKGIDLHSLRCPVCDDDIETLHHTLLTCSFAKDIWERIQKWWNFNHLPISSISDIAQSPNPFLNTNHGVSIWQAAVWVTSYHI
ncbi:uncharacterized protein [Rutidosis leptorrhynchoides]|uniref:uncharacterized protein n=1 Tax=Rutidosis leptorrhynchoides TaxID=125765 RepID=UPI003A99FA01